MNNYIEKRAEQSRLKYERMSRDEIVTELKNYKRSNWKLYLKRRELEAEVKELTKTVVRQAQELTRKSS